MDSSGRKRKRERTAEREARLRERDRAKKVGFFEIPSTQVPWDGLSPPPRDEDGIPIIYAERVTGAKKAKLHSLRLHTHLIIHEFLFKKGIHASSHGNTYHGNEWVI